MKVLSCINAICFLAVCCGIASICGYVICGIAKHLWNLFWQGIAAASGPVEWGFVLIVSGVLGGLLTNKIRDGMAR